MNLKKKIILQSVITCPNFGYKRDGKDYFDVLVYVPIL